MVDKLDQDSREVDVEVDMAAVEAKAEAGAADATTESESQPKNKAHKSSEALKPWNKCKRLVNRYWAKKKWTIPATVLVLLVIILAIPVTRYASLGLFLKSTVSVTLVDSTTNTPVSSASVSVGGHAVYTNAEGKVSSKQKLGKRTLTITKQYYKTSTEQLTVTFSKAHNTATYHLVANGRQVPITVSNKITGKPIVGAEVVILSPHATASKTDKTGKATIVLPTTAATQKASVTAAGYNALSTTVQVTAKDVVANHFSVTPAGKLYFLSNQSGKIDVVKTNLDGTDRQTVLAGTGSEDPQSTSLLASRDWKYLALLSRRSGDKASLYLIDTSTDKLTTIDEGDAQFTLVGWANDTFTYYVNRNGYDSWQPKATAIKTYDAPNAKLNVVYQTGASGNSQNYATESLSWIQQVGTKLVWYSSWSGHITYYSDAYTELNGKQDQVVEYDTTKNSTKTLQAYTVAVPTSAYANTYYSAYTSYQSIVYKPNEIYFLINTGDSTNSSIYSEYEDGKLTENSDEAKTYFQGSQGDYPTYLDSPSANQTFWTDLRDGKNALFVGDADGANGKQIASLSEYSPYGWYSDSYLLVSKNSSELYIMAADGSTAPQKITDYYKPATNYRGYGGGYGGL